MDIAACEKLMSNLWASPEKQAPPIDYRPTIILCTILIVVAIIISAYMIVYYLKPLFSKTEP